MTTNSSSSLRMYKRLLQFNQLVFRFGWISDLAYSSSFKGESISYTNNAHGSYDPTFGQFSKLNSTTLTATVEVDFKDIDCEDRVRYAQYIRRQLSKSGKLWATQNGGHIIWTNARVVSVGEDIDSYASLDRLRMSIVFELTDGYWRLAKKTRTFLCENYCPNRFRDFDQYYCTDTGDLAGRCGESGASKCYPCLANLYKAPRIIGCYDTNTPYEHKADIPYHPLCYYTQKELQSMFNGSCPNEYYIDYNCENEKSYFCFDAGWGNKYRLNASAYSNHTIVSYCSKTDLPTDFVRIRLFGKFSNPRIRQLKPDFDYQELQDTGVIKKNSPVPDEYVKDYAQIGQASQGIEYMVNDFDVITYGYGIKVYGVRDYTNPDGTADNPPEDFVTRTETSNTPAFQIMPGINYFEITGNNIDDDSFVYIDPIEITY